MSPLDYFGSDAGLKFLANLVILTVLVGLLVSVFVVRSAWRGLRRTENRTNGRRVFARHMWRQALAGIMVLLLYLGVALDLLLIEDASIRSALARLGLFFALLLTVFRNLDVTYTQRKMRFVRARDLEAEAAAENLMRKAEGTAAALLKHAETTATELREDISGDAATVRRTLRDTNEATHRIEERLEEDNVISSGKQDIAAGKQDIAAGKQDIAADKQQADLDISERTREGVDRLERQGKEGK